MALTVVSGCPRSGTSIMMKILQTALGEERIIGGKRIDPPDLPPAIQYIQGKLDPDAGEKLEMKRDMNPDGFWECRYTVRGIRYNAMAALELREIEQGDQIMKIVSSGLVNTPPQYVDRVVYMLRHPRQVAKSQERLTRQLDTEGLGKVHTPEMFNAACLQAAKWFVANPEVPVLIVNYDDLIANPLEISGRLAEFTGYDGLWVKGAAEVKPSLKRSEPEEIEHELWQDAERLYELVGSQDWQGVIDYWDGDIRSKKANIQFYCPRRGRPTVKAECMNCKSGNLALLENFAKTAHLQGVEWEKEPCLWDVHFNPDYEGVRPTIEESITENHWNTLKKKDWWLKFRQTHKLGSKVEAITQAAGVKPCAGCRKRKRYLNGEK